MAVRWAWRAVALIVLVALAAGKAPIGARAQGADDLDALRARVGQLHGQGKYAEALAIAKRYVEAARQKYGEHHTHFGTAVLWLANIYNAQGHLL